jgi:hypothetical protein
LIIFLYFYRSRVAYSYVSVCNFLAVMPEKGGVIKKEDIVQWLTAKGVYAC